MTFDEEGNPVVLDKNGKPMKIEKDSNGNSYIINEKGEKVIISSAPVLKNVAVLNDENGSYIIDKTGKKRYV